jgi:splicing suppressor protein 51
VSEPRGCGSCANENTKLLQCSRCETVSYYDKDCQEADWKTHEPICTQIAESGSQPSQAEKPFKAGDQDKKPFSAIFNGVFFHDRTEEKTFQLLIDSLRIRQQDEYDYGGKILPGSIYDDESSSETAFRTFISKARSFDGLLPPWWTDSSVDECIEFSGRSLGFSLAVAQGKKDIDAAWGDYRMSMKLRVMTETVYGYAPGGHSTHVFLVAMLEVECRGAVLTEMEYGGWFWAD